MIGFESALAILSTLIVALLGIGVAQVRAISKDIKEMRNELASKQTVEACKDERRTCSGRTCELIRENWEALGHHSHTTLPADAKVTR